MLTPLQQAGEHAHHMPATTSLWTATLAVLVHSLAMLVTTGAVALAVYQWAGLDFLRRGWINLDLVWTVALIAMGLWLVRASPVTHRQRTGDLGGGSWRIVIGEDRVPTRKHEFRSGQRSDDRHLGKAPCRSHRRDSDPSLQSRLCG